MGPERFRLYDGGPVSPVVADSGLNTLATPAAGAAGEGKLWHPSSPMLAFGAIAALTFGAMAFSTSGTARVGKTRVTVGVGVGSTS